MYTEVTLYVLSQGQKGYSTLKKKRTTRKQLQAMWDKYGYDLAVPVDSKPKELLTIDTAPDCTDMGSIDLRDGIHLAVVMHQPMTYMDMLHDKVEENGHSVGQATASESCSGTHSYATARRVRCPRSATVGL